MPVLRVSGLDGKLRAVLFGYACHATVLSFNQFSGRLSGVCPAVCRSGPSRCRGIGFLPVAAAIRIHRRRTVELAEGYGRRLATAVEETLAGELQPISGELASGYREIDLPFAQLPSRDDLARDAGSKDRFVANRARLLLAQIDAGQALSSTYPYPIEVWRIGRELTFVALGGEVVVDYALRLKHELGSRGLWVAAYANDVMAYIPSRRVLAEGGYEGGGAKGLLRPADRLGARDRGTDHPQYAS